MKVKKYLSLLLAALMVFAAVSCSSTVTSKSVTDTTATTTSTATVSGSNYSDSSDGGHAIEANGTTAVYSDITVTKTGDADGDNADFYGENAAVFATNKATLTITNATIDTNGKHANGVFSYGSGTTATISDSTITTYGNCSGGIMTTGGGTTIATDLIIHTYGNSSASIRSDRGGGTVSVNGGSYITEGTGSPAIYSTAEITVTDAYLESTASQGVVVEGKNSVTLENCTLVASNIKKNSKKSSWYQAVMIYQSMSGDASTGTSSFTMNGGSLVNANGDIFFVNNTACEISLYDAEILNNDADGLFLRAAAAGWGKSGSNGGKINLYAAQQSIVGDIAVDSVSVLNFYLNDESSFVGSISNEGKTFVSLDSTSTWTLTADSYVTSLTCSASSINLNGYTLYVNGTAYTEGTSSTGSATSITK